MKAIIYTDGRFRGLVPDDTITDPEFTRIWVEEKPPVPAEGNVVEEAAPEVTATHALQRWLVRPKSDPELAAEADAADLVQVKAAHAALKAGEGADRARITRLERILARIMKEIWGLPLLPLLGLFAINLTPLLLADWDQGTYADETGIYPLRQTATTVNESVVGLPVLPAQTSSNSIVASVRLTWDPNPETDLAGYLVHRGIAPGTRLETRDVGLVTTNDWTGLLPGVTNYFTVTAYNTAGLESDPSNEIAYEVRSEPAKPVIASATVTVVQTTVWQTVTNVYELKP